MSDTLQNITTQQEWFALREHQKHIASQHMRDWFAQDQQRFARYSLSVGEIFLDYSRNRITDETLTKLFALAEISKLREKMADLFSGQPINLTEQRAVLHSALRAKHTPSIMVDGQNIAETIREAKEKLRSFVDKVLQGKHRGITGKPFKHVVNVGIGGSHLGPMMATHALKDFAVSPLQFHFVATVDKDDVRDMLQRIDPETTLFIISSKTFSTIETLTNAQTIANFMRAEFGETVLKHHFVATTSAAEKACSFGIDSEYIFPLWDFIGGRYSIWSAIGLPLMLQIGNAQFDEFLEGAYLMDQHFLQTEFAKNMPVLLALLSIWYLNFFNCSVSAVIPYAHRLRYLIPYLQQAEMESNGKSVNIDGKNIAYATGPVIFGEEGCNGQHTYHQLLLQGKHLIPVDFILLGKNTTEVSDEHHHDILLASGLSQAQALMRGKTYAESYQELLTLQYPKERAAKIAHHRVIPGNRPSNIIFIERLTPKNLGSLIALYEHKIFVQGVIWEINSFDQWGVELGKQLLPTILNHVQGKSAGDLDPATLALIRKIRDKANVT